LSFFAEAKLYEFQQNSLFQDPNPFLGMPSAYGLSFIALAYFLGEDLMQMTEEDFLEIRQSYGSLEEYDALPANGFHRFISKAREKPKLTAQRFIKEIALSLVYLAMPALIVKAIKTALKD
jgi:hypothetical protein